MPKKFFQFLVKNITTVITLVKVFNSVSCDTLLPKLIAIKALTHRSILILQRNRMVIALNNLALFEINPTMCRRFLGVFYGIGRA